MSDGHRILIVRFSSIGDIILATSPLRTIRQTYPKSHITFLTLTNYSSILEYHPDIDAVMALRKTPSVPYHWRFSRLIIEKRFDLIFDLHNSLRSKFIFSNYKGQMETLKKPRLNRFLLFQFHLNRFNNDFNVPLMYHQNLGSIWEEGDPVPKTSLSISKQESKQAEMILKNNSIRGSYVVIVPGAAWKQKQWSVEKYAELCRAIKNDFGLDSVVIGTKNDKICFQIADKVPGLVNLASKTSIRESMALISGATRVVGSDTGLTHAAEALGTKVTMILGPTSRETGATTILEDSICVESKDTWCRPCSQNGSKACYRSSQVCMDSIKTEEVHNTFVD